MFYVSDEIKNKSGNFTVNYMSKPNLYHVLYIDDYTCGDDSTEIKPNYIQYTIQLLNPDSLGNPTEHFGDDETGNQENRTERTVALISKSVKKYKCIALSLSVTLFAWHLIKCFV